jgi:hypothetical protein
MDVANRSKQRKRYSACEQKDPRTLVWAIANRRLSKNEPTIASTVPTSSEGMNVADRSAYSTSCVLSKLCFSNTA